MAMVKCDFKFCTFDDQSEGSVRLFIESIEFVRDSTDGTEGLEKILTVLNVCKDCLDSDEEGTFKEFLQTGSNSIVLASLGSRRKYGDDE